MRASRKLHDGDELDFGGGAITIAVPGHTPGSAAFYLPAPRVLIAGDALAFRADGHAEPVTRNAAARLRTAVPHPGHAQ